MNIFKILRKSYGKTVMEFFREFAESMDSNKEYKVSEVKKYISDNIKRESGISVKPRTINCHIYATIVNEKNRLHYNVTKKNCDYKNLFYYIDENRKEVIRRFLPNINGINIYVK